MVNSDLKIRTKDYALSVIRLFAVLPKRTETQILGRQLLRSGTSVGAQYREATRAKSNLDFISKIEGALQELEESEYWLELLSDAGFGAADEVAAIKKRNRRTQGNIREYSPKHQSQVESPETLNSSFLSFIFLPLSFFITQSRSRLGLLICRETS